MTQPTRNTETGHQASEAHHNTFYAGFNAPVGSTNPYAPNVEAYAWWQNGYDTRTLQVAKQHSSQPSEIIMTTATATKKQVKVSAKKVSPKTDTFTFESRISDSPEFSIGNDASRNYGEKKANIVPQQVSIPSTTPDHLSPKSHTTVINCIWKDMQKLAKEWGIKAGGRGVTSDVLHTWLCDFQKLGAQGFAAKHPEAVKKATVTKEGKESKEVVSNHAAFNNMTFRQAQALVKKMNWKVEGVKANSWAGLNQLAATHAK